MPAGVTADSDDGCLQVKHVNLDCSQSLSDLGLRCYTQSSVYTENPRRSLKSCSRVDSWFHLNKSTQTAQRSVQSKLLSSQVCLLLCWVTWPRRNEVLQSIVGQLYNRPSKWVPAHRKHSWRNGDSGVRTSAQDSDTSLDCHQYRSSLPSLKLVRESFQTQRLLRNSQCDEGQPVSRKPYHLHLSQKHPWSTVRKDHQVLDRVVRGATQIMSSLALNHRIQ